MPATPKPVRKEIKKHESHHRHRIAELEKKNQIAPKALRVAVHKSKGKALRKAETKYEVESTMQNRKDRAQMKR